jgi:hypothetical protein
VLSSYWLLLQSSSSLLLMYKSTNFNLVLSLVTTTVRIQNSSITLKPPWCCSFKNHPPFDPPPTCSLSLVLPFLEHM